MSETFQDVASELCGFEQQSDSHYQM